jgi:hypothetical protein
LDRKGNKRKNALHPNEYIVTTDGDDDDNNNNNNNGK